MAYPVHGMGLLSSINLNQDLKGFEVRYLGNQWKRWVVDSDSTKNQHRTIVIKCEGSNDKNIVISLEDGSVDLDGQAIPNPNLSILISDPNDQRRVTGKIV